MSFSEVRPFFRARLENLGYHEHAEPFELENNPGTLIDRSYQLTNTTITGGPASHQPHEFDFTIQVNVMYKGYRNVSEAVDEATAEIENIYSEILSPSNRLNTGIKDVVPLSVETLPLAESNDNIIVMQYNYGVKLICNF